MFVLRGYQSGLSLETIDHMNSGGAPCLVSPTGSGKTVMLAEIARIYREWGYPVLLAAHRNEIIKQIAASCKYHCGEPVGFYSADRMTEDRGIMVTMIPTLARRRSAIPTFRNRVLLLDEAHHIQAKSYQEIIRELQPAFFAGATATPVTPTGAGLGKYGITKLILGPQPKQLMDEGSLCTYRMFGGNSAVVDTTGIPMQGGDYKKDILEERIVEVQGECLRDLLLFNPDLHPTIAVTVNIDSANEIAKQYNTKGISARVIIGKTPTLEREKAFEEFRAGDLKVIVSVALIDEGLDLPEATCLQLIRPTRSLRLWKQLIGRVLRKDKNRPDKVALIIDHGNCWENLPLPHQPIEWALNGKVKFTKPSLELNERKEVVESAQKPERITVVRGNKQRLKEIDIEDIYQQRLQKRVNAAKKNIYLVEAKGFNPQILWPWATNPEGLNQQQCRAIERALALPPGYCMAQMLSPR